MRKSVFIILAIILAGSLSVSCKKDDNNGHSAPVPVVDPAIVGSWQVTGYEALNKQYETVKKTEDQSVIHATYWRFDFAEDSTMTLWYGNMTSSLAVIDFFYGNGILYFGDTGFATVEILTADTMVFVSDSFMPSGWENDFSIKAVRTTCKKK